MDPERNARGLAVATLDQVTECADRVLIVASGPSAEKMDLNIVAEARLKGVYVMAVNRAWDWCRYIDGWFTLDPNRQLIRYLVDDGKKVMRYVAVPDDYGSPKAAVHYHRNMPLFPNVVYLRRLTGEGRLSIRYGLSTDPHCIHTGNSAYGALGIARHMGATRVGLIGVDANRQLGYAHQDGFPMTFLNHLPRLFASAKEQLESDGISVQNGSPASLVKCFPRHHPNAVIKWLMEDL